MTHEDNPSLLEWLRGKELEAINKANIPPRTKGITEAEKHGYYMQSKAFREVINHIENNPKELHRCLIPAGWDYV